MTITVSHANEPDTKIDVVASQVFYVRYSAPQRATIIVSIGGAFCPVKESPEEVKALLRAINKEGPKEGQA